MTMDPDILEQITNRIEADPRIGHEGLSLDVDGEDGTVLLEGLVSRLADKRRIESIALDVDGVDAVDNRLTVRPDVDVSDAELRENIARALMQDRSVDGTYVDVSVSEGVVTLRGTVLSLTMKRYVGVLAWWVPGVRDVNNQLDLVAPEEDNDDEIREAVAAAIDKDYLVDSMDITVHSHRGVVTLRGAVFGEEQREAAENDAWFVLGVRDVNNELRVSPAEPPRWSGGSA